MHGTTQFGWSARLLIALLLCLLSVPAFIGFVWSDVAALQKLENRRMAPFPRLSQFRKSPAQFNAALDRYLKDHVGLRRVANQLYRKLRFYVLKDPPLPNVSIGKDGAVFLNSMRANQPNVAFEVLCKQQVNPDPKLIEEMDRTFASVSGYYANRGYKVTIAAAPTNISLYPDKLPLTVDKKYRDACQAYPASDTLLARLERLGQTEGRYALYYPLKMFRAHRNEPYFYPKETFHWLGRSAYLYARDLLRFSGVVDRLIVDDLVELGDGADDMVMFFGFSRAIKAMSYAYANFMTTVTEPEWGASLTKGGEFQRFTTTNSISGKRGLLFANSFGISLAPHLAKGFSELYSCNLNHVKPEEEKRLFSEIIDLTKPDFIYVLFDEVGMIKAPQRLGAFIELYRKQRNASAGPGVAESAVTSPPH